MKFNFLSKIQNVRSEIDLVVDVEVTSWFIFNTLLIVIVEIFQCSDRHRKENPERYMYVVILILIGLVISVFGNGEVNHGSTKMKVKRRE
jgi:NADH:ubiquinone oxidoreductase subunit 4 (subunit M)